jgi:hypothetical protein
MEVIDDDSGLPFDLFVPRSHKPSVNISAAASTRRGNQSPGTSKTITFRHIYTNLKAVLAGRLLWERKLCYSNPACRRRGTRPGDALSKHQGHLRRRRRSGWG